MQMVPRCPTSHRFHTIFFLGIYVQEVYESCCTAKWVFYQFVVPLGLCPRRWQQGSTPVFFRTRFGTGFANDFGKTMKNDKMGRVWYGSNLEAQQATSSNMKQPKKLALLCINTNETTIFRAIGFGKAWCPPSPAMAACLNAWLRCTSRGEEAVGHALGRVAKVSSRNPWKCVLISLLGCLLCGLGFLRFNAVSKARELWVDQHSQQMKNLDWTEGYFPAGGRMSCRLIITAKDGGNVLEPWQGR
eukprot:s1754_g6.t1